MICSTDPPAGERETQDGVCACVHPVPPATVVLCTVHACVHSQHCCSPDAFNTTNVTVVLFLWPSKAQHGYTGAELGGWIPINRLYVDLQSCFGHSPPTQNRSTIVRLSRASGLYLPVRMTASMSITCVDCQPHPGDRQDGSNVLLSSLGIDPLFGTRGMAATDHKWFL